MASAYTSHRYSKESACQPTAQTYFQLRQVGSYGQSDIGGRPLTGPGASFAANHAQGILCPKAGRCIHRGDKFNDHQINSIHLCFNGEDKIKLHEPSSRKNDSSTTWKKLLGVERHSAEEVKFREKLTLQPGKYSVQATAKQSGWERALRFVKDGGKTHNPVDPIKSHDPLHITVAANKVYKLDVQWNYPTRTTRSPWRHQKTDRSKVEQYWILFSRIAEIPDEYAL
ncbi:expressed unknown protein [Seminavis robusta]|uniref:Uncharacterized protein n=1 Tax=Seminavis robusta TaxID=568900 RepID=A0A9N8D8E3_9STRA|nr:expressed unknown protein [Seminavis robusta]|eukprot:Sro1_g000300.1 n/a (227) ;mRNA; r:91666-92445